MSERSIEDLIFVGFNRRVVALDRIDGQIVWDWKAAEGTGYPSVLLDGDRLIVGVGGYIYCLDPLYGQEVWSNPLKGKGTGITSVVSVRGATYADPAAAAAAEAAQQQSAAAATGGTAGSF